MADRIKGITIEIDGDTKGLSKALQGVNKDIKTTQTQLKDIEKLLKLDPHNVTLLGQKMEALGKQINSTKDKLSQLKSVSDEMEKGLKNGSITAEQYDAWQREIIQTENELKNLEAELKAVPSTADAMLAGVSDKFDALGGKIQNVGDKVSSLGDTMSKTFTAGIVAAGTASVKAWQDVDSAMDDLIAKTGATGEAFEELQATAERIATTIPTDFKTSANAVGEVSTRFDATGKTLEELSTAFIEFATLNNTDVVGSIDSVSGMMNAWGIDAKDTVKVLDTLNAVSQQTGISSDQLSEILQSNALSFKEMDYDLAQAAYLMGQMDKNGVDASAGLTALRKAMSKATDENKSLNEIMTEWQALMDSNISDAEKMAATEDLFGSRAYAQLFNALQEGTISFTEINASMSDFEGNLSRTFEATLDPVDEFTTTLNELKLFGSEIGSEILPVLVDVLKDLKPILDDLREAWESMSEEEQKELITNLGKIAALGPALSVGGRAISGVGSAISGLAKAGKALSGLGIGAKLSSLFGGASGAGTAVGASIGTSIVAGIGAALVGLEIGKLLDNYVLAPIMDYFGDADAKWYKNFSFFGDGGLIEEMFDFNSVKEAIDVYGGAIELALNDRFVGLKESLKIWGDLFATTKDKIKSSFEATVQGITDAVNLIKETMSLVWDSITTKVSTTWDGIKAKFDEFKQGVTDAFTSIYDTIKGIWDSLGELFQQGFDLKLPHISVSGGVPPYGINGMGKLPQFDVDWYANGGILTQPTIFGMNGGHLVGGGEAGAEAVLPLSNLQSMITEGMTQALGNGGDTVINVSIDNNSLGSVLLTAQQMMNLRRGK
ncbi:MAG: phage tail tape measure protein [Clostridia bacterium]|nr:phage tail tape measure protein [Clostridia bacterium]